MPCHAELNWPSHATTAVHFGRVQVVKFCVAAKNLFTAVSRSGSAIAVAKSLAILLSGFAVM